MKLIIKPNGKFYIHSGMTNTTQPTHRCKDFDSDCLTIENHLNCWAYDKERGYCPFLQDKGKFSYSIGKKEEVE